MTNAAAHHLGFKALFTLSEGILVPEFIEGHRTLHYEFIDTAKDGVVYKSE